MSPRLEAMQADQIVESVNGPGTGWGGLGTVEDLELVALLPLV